MISSLKSNFSLYERRAICIAGDRIIVYHWSNGRIAEPLMFTADDNGLAHFERYVKESERMPVYLMADVVEEEYRQDTIPHAFGKDRRALIERKKQRLFRGTPYCHAAVQGRESEGRRDDQVLLTALTNPEAITPIVGILEQHKVPLAGVYSLPLLSKQLLKKLQVKSENVLLVTLQSASGLRQTFFRDQELKISRLAKTPRLGTVPFGDYMLGELGKFRRYLNSLRVVSRDSPLEIYVLSHGEYLDELETQCQDSEGIHYHLLDVEEVGGALDIGQTLGTPYSDRLLAHLLLETAPKNHYAGRDETRYFSLHQTRLSLLAASVVLLLGSLVWSGFNFLEGVALKQQALDAHHKADFYRDRYEIAKEKLPPTPVEAMDIKAAVNVVERLARLKSDPFTVLERVSGALSQFPDLQIDSVDWASSTDPNITVSELEDGEQEMIERAIEPNYTHYHIAVVGGHLAPFDGDYRSALALMRRFADALREQDAIHHVRLVVLPLDVSSGSSLQGSAATTVRGARASFAVKVVMGVGDGAS